VLEGLRGEESIAEMCRLRERSPKAPEETTEIRELKGAFPHFVQDLEIIYAAPASSAHA
jgi:hypothetical protein